MLNSEDVQTKCLGVVGDGKNFCIKKGADCPAASHQSKKIDDSILTESGDVLALRINESKALTDSIWPVYSMTKNALKYLMERKFTVDDWIVLYNKLSTLRSEKGLDEELIYSDVVVAVADLSKTFDFEQLASPKVSVDTKAEPASPAMSFERIDSFVPDDSKNDPEDMVALLARIEKIETYLKTLAPSVSEQLCWKCCFCSSSLARAQAIASSFLGWIGTC